MTRKPPGCWFIFVAVVAACNGGGLPSAERDGGSPDDLAVADLATTADLGPDAACTDGVLDGQESDVDCGGPSCARCATGKRCTGAADCRSRACGGDHTCARLTLSFEAQTLVSLCSFGGLGAADFDGDGSEDLLDVGGDGAACFLLNQGAGTFVTSKVQLVNYRTGLSGIADLDSDGRPDLVLGCSSTYLHGCILQNTGALRFVAYDAFYFSRERDGMHVERAANLDGDGRLDLITGFNSGKLGVFLNQGLGARWPLTVIDPGLGQIASTAIGDLDGDGRLDVAVANGSSRLALVFGKEGGLEAFPSPIDAGEQVLDLAAVDADGDGKLDLAAVLSQSSRLAVRRVEGGSFTAASPPFAVAAGRHMMAADLDADGHPDLLRVSYGHPFVHVLLGDGLGSFAAPVDLDGPGNAVTTLGGPVVADWNGDGKLDVAVLAQRQTDAADLILLYLNTSR